MAKRDWAKDHELLRFIEQYAREHSYPPSLREMTTAMGYTTTSMVHVRLVRLKDEGVLQWEPKKSRTLRVTMPAEQEG